MSDTIRIVLVDDQQLVRIGLRTILETFDDFVIVGEAVPVTKRNRTNR